MNYFDFFHLPIAFQLDEKALKRQFYINSKKYHPDFFVQESQAKQEEILELATQNNKAYKVLSKLDSRIKYVLETMNCISEGERYQMPPTFLLQMMDINESLMDMQMEGTNSAKSNQLTKEVADMEQELIDAIQPILNNYSSDSPNSAEQLQQVKGYYYKKRYLLRIKESLAKMG